MLTTATFSGLGDLPGGYSTSAAYGISADGSTIVGVGSDEVTETGVRWAGDLPESLGLLPGDSTSRAYATSADGSAIVGYSNDSSFRWTEEGGMTEIPDLPGDHGGSLGFSEGAFDVSADGTAVVGGMKSESGIEAFIWQEGVGTRGLGDLRGGAFASVAKGVSADGQVVVGWSAVHNNYARDLQAFRWTEETGMQPLYSPGNESEAHDLSADGSVVVGRDRRVSDGAGGWSTIGWEASRWTENGFDYLGDLPGGSYYSVAHTVSEDGSVIAGESNSDIGREAFIWDEGNGMRSLQDLLTTDYGVDLTGWQLTTVHDMTPDGSTLVGKAINPTGDTEAFVVTLPPAGPGITVTPTSGLQTTEVGGTAQFTVVLDTLPTAEVSVAVSSSDVSEGQVQGAIGGVLTLHFDDTNWDQSQTVTIVGADDQELDGEQAYSIQLDSISTGDVDYDALARVTVSATNLDNEVPVASTMYVGDISLETTTSGRNKVDYRIAVLVMQENGASDLPLAGVQVTVTFAGKTYTGVTDSDGLFRSNPIKGVKSGNYYANVVDLTFATFDWDTTFDVEDDSDDNSFPDELLTI